jgi:hypothetical protein
VAAQLAKESDRFVLALALIEEAEENLRSARELIREWFASSLPQSGTEGSSHGRAR